MGIIGIGTDILSVERIRRCLDSTAFIQHTFTEAESRLSASCARPAEQYARVFAGKEAVFKCFGMEADVLRSWTEIEVIDYGEAQPVVNLRGALRAAAAARSVRGVVLSLSHDGGYVTAVAALVGGER